eukprot:442905-Rhodomonas_salina.2
MRVGEVRRLRLPAPEAYGDKGMPGRGTEQGGRSEERGARSEKGGARRGDFRRDLGRGRGDEGLKEG